MLVNWDLNWSSQLHQLHVASLCGLSFLKHEIQISYMMTQDSKSEWKGKNCISFYDLVLVDS